MFRCSINRLYYVYFKGLLSSENINRPALGSLKILTGLCESKVLKY